MDRLTDAEIRMICIEIANGRGNHGGFLRSLADTVLRADPQNFQHVRDGAAAVLDAYSLRHYLDVKEEENDGTDTRAEDRDTWVRNTFGG